ncbi:bacillithiol biosynthesis deacetylase BshB1 [Cytophagaceae bacterium DM2B3-1]|uniref:Bacillithiol biosynthesis deacetylase BshB1 n=1 Tax=Xanthocytophaga flava TaxID=3048013 RepID=A0ABT7CPL2_9BACT|nr:bacillithiol biosynthesis deacetylase BshB1 [Xanthocytophaga flavus]MDJ1494917.1 bacillithiol biosynthesis deacetylase BshB1 [Xanthocytophaga flavus]
MKIDILAIVAHPDDAELACSGTLLAHAALGKKIGIVDLTRGELGTRGTPEIRKQEAAASAAILQLDVRENLGLPDGFFENTKEYQLEVIRAIRKHQPDIVLTNAITDRHCDHGRAAQLVKDSCFLSGLVKVETVDNGISQSAWRPKIVYHVIQDTYIEPDIIVDISSYWDKKEASIKAFGTQFFNPSSSEPITHISKPEFLDFQKARAIEFGHRIGVLYGEGFTTHRTPGVANLFDLK